ncbi:MAG: RyR domain-containing protein [Actinomycetota bacterium]
MAAEYRVALALGATVALVQASGREAARLVPDKRLGSAERLLPLPADSASVRAYVGVASVSLPEDLREAVAKGLHNEFKTARETELRPEEPRLAEWETLLPEYRESTLRQADDTFAKLALVGLEVVAGEEPPIFATGEDDVELLAEIEPGRWVVERLLSGWRWGPAKDVKPRVSPYLVPWDELPDGIRKWDSVFIRAIPESLAGLGYEVRKKA